MLRGCCADGAFTFDGMTGACCSGSGACLGFVGWKRQTPDEKSMMWSGAVADVANYAARLQIYDDAEEHPLALPTTHLLTTGGKDPAHWPSKSRKESTKRRTSPHITSAWLRYFVLRGTQCSSHGRWV
mmetsp:Transcript_20802/g.49274  ORF Transcript_20802/g.49274 Transcript_20802/m.49274 type:complete len:128 (-) Transcript_20802:558-941(-)